MAGMEAVCRVVSNENDRRAGRCRSGCQGTAGGPRADDADVGFENLGVQGAGLSFRALSGMPACPAGGVRDPCAFSYDGAAGRRKGRQWTSVPR